MAYDMKYDVVYDETDCFCTFYVGIRKEKVEMAMIILKVSEVCYMYEYVCLVLEHWGDLNQWMGPELRGFKEMC